MGIGIGLFLVAVGAVLSFAVTAATPGIDLDAVGVIFMGAGAVVFLYTLIWWSDMMPWRRDRTVLRERDVDAYVRPLVRAEPRHTVERRGVSYERRAS